MILETSFGKFFWPLIPNLQLVLDSGSFLLFGFLILLYYYFRFSPFAKFSVPQAKIRSS